MEVFNFERLGAEPENHHWIFLFAQRSQTGNRPEVGGLVHPDDKGVPVGDKDPLADVKLGVVDQQRPLYVLLHHISGPVSAVKFLGPRQG